MDLKHTTTTTTTLADSPDTDSETPLHSQLIKPFSTFPNRKNHHHQPPPPPIVSYKECLKNHAATIGSHALDGCGEYMPPLTTTPHEPPTSLKCAACGCHRNFHRREHVINDVYAAYAPHVLLSFSSPDHHQTNLNQMVAVPGTPAENKIENPNGRKRFRTKFSQEQKEKMYLFAEKVGWKMQRCDDKVVMEFCNEVGIKRGIFKVWMHNNKNTFGKRDKETSSSPVAPAVVTTTTAGVTDKSIGINDNGRVVDVNEGDDMSESSDHDQDRENGGGGGDRHGFNNGSSSSC